MTPITWNTLDGKTGHHSSNGRKQLKSQTHKQNREHTEPRNNNTKTKYPKTIFKSKNHTVKKWILHYDSYAATN